MDTFFSVPPSYEAVKRRLYCYKKKFSNLRLFHIGRSVTGRRIFAVGIGNLKNANLYTATTHAQEWLTTLLMFRFLEDLLTARQKNIEFCGASVSELFNSRGFLMVPLVNPDGLEIAINGPSSARFQKNSVKKMQEKSPLTWQANARGVDLNHNFDAGFQILKQMERKAGIVKPGPRRYGGICPHSEPETRALVHLCEGLNIKKVFAFHSQGEEIYYHYGENTPSNARLLAEALAVPCGYKVCHPEGMASHGGFKDWFIQNTHRCGFTIEIGKGENPLPIEDLEPIYAQLKETLFLGTLI